MTSTVKGVKISELMSGSQEEQDEKLNQLLQSALEPDKRQLAHQYEALQSRIIKFERRYEMSSTQMLEKLSRGLVKETADVCSWLMLLKALDGCRSEPTKTWAKPI